MLLWLQVAFANDYNLISEKKIHTQTYHLYTEYEYSLPKINLQSRSIEVEISTQNYCVTEHHYEQQWKIQAGGDVFRKKNHSRKYIHYDVKKGFITLHKLHLKKFIKIKKRKKKVIL